MEYLIKKTYLGLAVESAVEEIGLQRINKELSLCFREAFFQHEASLSAQHSPVASMSCEEEKLKEAPIGFACCLSLLGSKSRYKGEVEFLSSCEVSCFEAFGDEGPQRSERKRGREGRRRRKGNPV